MFTFMPHIVTQFTNYTIRTFFCWKSGYRTKIIFLQLWGHLEVTCKNLDCNLKNKRDIDICKFSYNEIFSFCWHTKISVTRSILEIKSSSFGFSPNLCLASYAQRPIFKNFIFLVPSYEGVGVKKSKFNFF